MKTIVLRKGKSASLKRFHPWVFSGAIAKKDSGIQEGETVRVVNESEEFLAVGHFENGSIAVRVLSFDDRKIDAAFWEERIREFAVPLYVRTFASSLKKDQPKWSET